MSLEKMLEQMDIQMFSLKSYPGLVFKISEDAIKLMHNDKSIDIPRIDKKFLFKGINLLKQILDSLEPKREEQPEIDEMILSLLEKHGDMHHTEMTKHFKVANSTVLRHLNELAEDGKVGFYEETNKGRAGRGKKIWTLIKPEQCHDPDCDGLLIQNKNEKVCSKCGSVFESLELAPERTGEDYKKKDFRNPMKRESHTSIGTKTERTGNMEKLNRMNKIQVQSNHKSASSILDYLKERLNLTSCEISNANHFYRKITDSENIPKNTPIRPYIMIMSVDSAIKVCNQRKEPVKIKEMIALLDGNGNGTLTYNSYSKAYCDYKKHLPMERIKAIN